MKLTHLTHLTLNTGHSRTSPRSEVSDDTLNVLRPWLTSAIQSDDPIALPSDGLDDYKAKAVQQHGLSITLYAKNDSPLVTFGIAETEKEAEALLKIFENSFGVKASVSPCVPLCAVVVHPHIALHADVFSWAGDFERCVAWVWLTRDKAHAAFQMHDGPLVSAGESLLKHKKR